MKTNPPMGEPARKYKYVCGYGSRHDLEKKCACYLDFFKKSEIAVYHIIKDKYPEVNNPDQITKPMQDYAKAYIQLK